jgi:farnesyl-diphosphate farnesyltransferase
MPREIEPVEEKRQIASAGVDGLDDDRLQDLLVKSSRTFALAIPQLPQPTRREVTIAYLLFRIADTFEDASVLWSRAEQLRALSAFEGILREPSLQAAHRITEEWLRNSPTEHDGYRELLEETPGIIGSWLGLSDEARESIGEHTCRTARLMAHFVRKTDARGVLRLENLDDLRGYCYAVAGIVGEMLTELFLLGWGELSSIADYLRQRAAAFGEGLQLVNILKDSASDADEGRNYLPSGVSRSEVFELARADLMAASGYALAIQQAGGPDGIVAFTALPVELAWSTLDRVEEHGPGSKISRETVLALYERVHRAIAEKRPVLDEHRGGRGRAQAGASSNR